MLPYASSDALNKELSLDQLKIHPELKNYLPGHSQEELSVLESSILKEQRVHEKLLVWQSAAGDLYLLDGHARLEVLLKHMEKGIKWDYEIIGQFDNIDELKWRMASIQMGRRNLTPFQQAYLRGRMYLETKKAPYRPKGQRSTKGKTKELLAEQFKVSAATIERDAAFYKGVNCFADFYAEGETISEKEKILRHESIFTKGDLEAVSKLNVFPEIIYRYKKLQGDLQLVLEKPRDERMLFMMTFCDEQLYHNKQGESMSSEALEKGPQKEEYKTVRGVQAPPLVRRFDKWALQQKKQIRKILDGYSKQSLETKRKELENCLEKIVTLIEIVGVWEAGKGGYKEMEVLEKL